MAKLFGLLIVAFSHCHQLERMHVTVEGAEWGFDGQPSLTEQYWLAGDF